MFNNLLRLSLVLLLLPFFTYANVITLKDSAPKTYVVKPGDTLWDISNLFLHKPWHWPQIWRTNTQIINPHLIFPGDQLRLSINAKGQPIVDLIRGEQKPYIVRSPSTKQVLKSQQPIAVLPWQEIQPYFNHELVLSEQEYADLPAIVGNTKGTEYFANGDLVLVNQEALPMGEYRVVRKQQSLFNQNGEFLGSHIRHVAQGQALAPEMPQQSLVTLSSAKLEVKRGDRLIKELAATEVESVTNITAATEQRGNIIADVSQYQLSGKFSVVIIDVGSDDIARGTVMGIYQQGAAVIDAEPAQYLNETQTIERLFKQGDVLPQPWMKVGELLVFNVFSKVSYALVTRSSTVIRKGAIVAKP
ncbi:LysM domain-containing protein [Paraglaciecola chathamensis]|uniref:LysM peptidoglycan-binding domain-containing protein n=1 Tax=Paraglaciecola chathamensis TaxID=368405 RepID=UPI002701B1BD|nr:LysM domain-containing protein [Paraglaciecola chathamensis]MDO6841136.1 LysM domain-containing protein [Paraglaciecola chathamensis]